jgi:hypothetical protein
MMPESVLPWEPELGFEAAGGDHRHEPGPELDWTETTWWSWNVPERGLGGWLYGQVRPNVGIVHGGAFVYGPGAFAPWDQPYWSWTSYTGLPETWDFDDLSFKNGVRVKALEPGMRYELGYQFRDQRDLIADFCFEGLTEPVPHLRGQPPFTGSSHFDQHGRVTGTMLLRGEELEVDCLAVRDRSWGRRPELMGRRGKLSYAFGSSRRGEAFLIFCVPPDDDPLSSAEVLSSGYLYRDGVLRYLAEGTRRTTRDWSTGCVTSIEISCADTDGRRLEASGRTRSAVALPSSGICINAMIEWELAGERCWGEDQDVWPNLLLGDLRHRRPPEGGW